jgi:mRNA interferase MazF
MNCGGVVLAEVQQADGLLKPRPVVVLNKMPPFGDFLVCALSSRLQHECQGFDEVIDAEADDYSQSGLKVPSLIRIRGYSPYRIFCCAGVGIPVPSGFLELVKQAPCPVVSSRSHTPCRKLEIGG